MARPERRIHLAGASPVRVSTGRSVAGPSLGKRFLRPERGVKSPHAREQGSGPQRPVNPTASSDYHAKGDREGRAVHVTAKATDSTPGDPNPCWPTPGYRRWHVSTGG